MRLQNSLVNKLQNSALFFINGLIGEVFVSLNIYDLVTRETKENSKLYYFQKDLLGIDKLYYKRVALSNITSCIYRYCEFYKEFKGKLNLHSDQIRDFIKKCESNAQLDDLRQIFHHAVNDNTGYLFTLQEVEDAFDNINKYFPDIFDKKNSEIIKIFFHTQDLLGKNVKEKCERQQSIKRLRSL